MKNTVFLKPLEDNDPDVRYACTTDITIDSSDDVSCLVVNVKTSCDCGVLETSCDC